jgi:hypothetical protein
MEEAEEHTPSPPRARPRRGAHLRGGDGVVVANDVDIARLFEKVPQTEEDKQKFFWDTIRKLEWKYASDGIVNGAAVKSVFTHMPLHMKAIFRDVYSAKVILMMRAVENDGLFPRNGVNLLEDKIKIVSHIIAMGQDQYNSIDMELLQYFVQQGECQSLDARLPDDLKY